MNKLTAHKNDIILLLVLAIAGLCVTGGYRLLHRTTGDTVTITVDGKAYRTLPLSVDTTLDIPGADGGTNHLEIKNGHASITEADCPDKLCVHQTSIRHNGESLVCLPHKVIVKVTANASEDDLDGVAK